MIFLFMAANAAKIVAFNSLLIQEAEPGFLFRKVYMTLLMIGILYPIFLIKWSKSLMVTAYILQAIYIAAGITYYLYFHTYLHVIQASALLSEAMSTAGNSAVQLDPKALISILDLPFFLLFILRVWRKPKPARKLRLIAIMVMMSSLFIFSISETISYINGKSFSTIINDTYAGESPIIERYGTLAANLVSLRQNGNGRPFEEQLKYGVEKVFAAAGIPSPNFVIIQVESMDSAIVSKRYKGAYVAPFLHSLTRTAVCYPFVLSYHEGGGTSDSEFSILNSVEPLDCYPALKLSNYSYPNSILTRLKAGGYSTLAFHGNKGSFYNRDIAFPKLGFSEFFDMAMSGLPENGWGLPDADMFGIAVEKLHSARQPFLAYVITMSSHEPFESVGNYYSNSLFDDIRDKTVRNYFNSMNYVDKSLQDFVSKLQAEFKNTYILITGDHAPNIEREGYMQASFTLENHYFEFVPLIIITPDGRSYYEPSEAASFLDISPTILKSSGTGASIQTDGRDLLDKNDKAGPIPYRGSSFDRSLLYKKAMENLR